LAYVVVNQIGFGIALYLANGVQGGPTSYFTAFAFFQLPYGIAAVSIMTALVPRLSTQYVEGDDPAFRATLAGALRTTALLVVPSTAIYLVLSKPLIQELLQHGVMRGASTGLVSAVLNMFAIGLLPFSAFVLLMRAFYARQDARTPLTVNVVENIVTVALDFILFPHMKVRGLALAHSLGYVAGSAMAYVLLARQLQGLEERRTLVELTKVVVAAAAATVAMLGVVALVNRVTEPGDGRALAQLLLAGAAGAGVFLGSARALRVQDLAVFRRLLTRK
jgi:putative peptidoglycan lipid II flippase